MFTASCQTFSDQFLQKLGSGGYMTYVKMGTSLAVVAGIVGITAGLIYFLSGNAKKDKNRNH